VQKRANMACMKMALFSPPNELFRGFDFVRFVLPAADILAQTARTYMCRWATTS
jgi:hypothetical protein